MRINIDITPQEMVEVARGFLSPSLNTVSQFPAFGRVDPEKILEIDQPVLGNSQQFDFNTIPTPAPTPAVTVPIRSVSVQEIFPDIDSSPADSYSYPTVDYNDQAENNQYEYEYDYDNDDYDYDDEPHWVIKQLTRLGIIGVMVIGAGIFLTINKGSDADTSQPIQARLNIAPIPLLPVTPLMLGLAQSNSIIAESELDLTPNPTQLLSCINNDSSYRACLQRYFTERATQEETPQPDSEQPDVVPVPSEEPPPGRNDGSIPEAVNPPAPQIPIPVIE
jgi:hypothetical protein